VKRGLGEDHECRLVESVAGQRGTIETVLMKWTRLFTSAASKSQNGWRAFNSGLSLHSQRWLGALVLIPISKKELTDAAHGPFLVSTAVGMRSHDCGTCSVRVDEGIRLGVTA
jgi:hypothetical protein